MSFADGELQGEARERAEKLVSESDEARRVVEAMRGPHIGIWLEDAIDRRADAVGADSIAETVMARLATPVEEVRVAPIRGARGGGAWQTRLAFAATCGAVALAAGVAFYLRSSATRLDDRAPVASVGAPSVDWQGPATTTTLAHQGVEVDDIDSPSRGISVFEIPVGGAAAAPAVSPARLSSVVIWIEDDPGAK
jgi:hypothetical protein